MSETVIEQEQDAALETAALEAQGDEPQASEVEPVHLEGADDDESRADDESGDDDERGDDEALEQERQAQAHSEQELEKLHGRISKANEAHVAKINRIMGEDALALIPCPVCMDFTAGLIFPPEVAPLPPNVQDRMRQLLGLNDWEDMPSAPWAQQCPDCKGHGEVKTGSSVPGKETTTCQTCGGDGWRNTTRTDETVPDYAAIPDESGPTMYGHEVSNDPEIDNLRRRGFTVIPPMHVANG